MGQSSLITLLGVSVTGALLLISMQRGTQDADEQLGKHQRKVFARDAARTGLHLAVRRLADDGAMGSWTNGADYAFPKTDYDGKAFSVDARTGDPSGGVSGDTVTLVARGYTAGAARQVIYARYARDRKDKGIPPAFENAISSDSYFQLKGNVSVRGIEDSINASIHTNESLEVRGNSLKVEGYGSYTGTVNRNVKDSFHPNVDYNGGDANYFQADSVKIPFINIDRLRSTASRSGTLVGSSTSISGEVVDFTDPSGAFWNTHRYNCDTAARCGTAEHPFVMVVEGDLTLQNLVQVKGYGTIVATGDIQVAPGGSGGGVYGDLNSRNETKVLLATQGGIAVSGNACFGLGPEDRHCRSPSGDHTRGVSLYAEGKIDFRGNPYVVGGIVAKNASFKGAGNPTFVYASGAEATLDTGFENVTPIGPVLVAYSEW